MIVMALVTVSRLSLNDPLIAFATAVCSAAVVAVRCMSTSGLAVHLNVATLALVPTGTADLHLAGVLGVEELVGSQGIFCDDSVQGY